MRRGPARGQPFGDLGEAQAGGDPDGGTRERVVDAVPAQCRCRDFCPLTGRPEDEAHPLGTQGGDALGPDVGILAEAVRQAGGLSPPRHPGHALVIRVQDRRSIGRQGFHELAFRPLDGVDGPEPGKVDAKHGSNDPDPGLRDARQLGDLAAGVHAPPADPRIGRVDGRRRRPVVRDASWPELNAVETASVRWGGDAASDAGIASTGGSAPWRARFRGTLWAFVTRASVAQGTLTGRRWTGWTRETLPELREAGWSAEGCSGRAWKWRRWQSAGRARRTRPRAARSPAG